jgi:hypothetical protein
MTPCAYRTWPHFLGGVVDEQCMTWKWWCKSLWCSHRPGYVRVVSATSDLVIMEIVGGHTWEEGFSKRTVDCQFCSRGHVSVSCVPVGPFIVCIGLRGASISHSSSCFMFAASCVFWLRGQRLWYWRAACSFFFGAGLLCCEVLELLRCCSYFNVTVVVADVHCGTYF